MATYHKVGKYNGTNEYEVRADGERVACLYRRYIKSTGHSLSGYVGHYPGGYEWYLAMLDDTPDMSFDRFEQAIEYVREL